ncbi:hypothetical protein ACEPAH_6497 [Sanghuangporus vaninii]
MDDHHEHASSAGQNNPGVSSPTSETYPKPPTPPLSIRSITETAVPSASVVADPPPPYPSRERRSRVERTRLRRAAQLSGESGVGGGSTISSTYSQQLRLSLDPLSNTQSEGSPLSPPEDGTETTPLLSPRRRPRTLSHSTGVSTHSIAQTVLSLFGSDEADVNGDAARHDVEEESAAPSSRKSLKRYFRPLWRRSYYRPLAHLLIINFPFALVTFLYLFVGTLVGTSLLIALPLGAVLCWLNLAGARAFAKAEIALQTYFHGPLLIHDTSAPYPIFSRANSTPSMLEAGQGTPHSQPSFLRNTYIMFTDQTSYQALFYFLVIKPSITLFLTLGLIVLVPASFILIVPAPAVLRAVRRIGVWQANIALEGLLHPQL